MNLEVVWWYMKGSGEQATRHVCRSNKIIGEANVPAAPPVQTSLYSIFMLMDTGKIELFKVFTISKL